MSNPVHEKAVVIGISGPSSSGKTTLARLLQRVFCGVNLKPEDSRLNTFIIHEDDFYFPDDKCVYTFFSAMHTHTHTYLLRTLTQMRQSFH